MLFEFASFFAAATMITGGSSAPAIGGGDSIGEVDITDMITEMTELIVSSIVHVTHRNE